DQFAGVDASIAVGVGEDACHPAIQRDIATNDFRSKQSGSNADVHVRVRYRSGNDELFGPDEKCLAEVSDLTQIHAKGEFRNAFIRGADKPDSTCKLDCR